MTRAGSVQQMLDPPMTADERAALEHSAASLREAGRRILACARSPPAESGRGEGAKPEITPPVTKRLKCEGAQWTAPRPGLIWHAHIKHDRLFFMYGHNQLNGPRSWRAERRI